MKDYSLILETIQTAEELLRNSVQLSNVQFQKDSKNVFEQVADYLHTLLSNAGFPAIQLRAGNMNTNDIPGDIALECFLNYGYLHNGEHFKAKLFIYPTLGSTATIYINESGYAIENNGNKDAALVLCKYWQELKAKIEPAIDAYFHGAAQHLKGRMQKIERDREIFDSFEL